MSLITHYLTEHTLRMLCKIVGKALKVHSLHLRWLRLQLTRPPDKKFAPLTTLSSNFKCKSAAEPQTGEQYSRKGSRYEQKQQTTSLGSANILHALRKISRLRETLFTVDRLRYQLGVHNHTQYLRLVHRLHWTPFANKFGNWGSSVLDRETVMALIFPALSFMSHRKHRFEITVRSALRETVAEVRFDGLGTTSGKVVLSAYSTRALLTNENSSLVCTRISKRPRTLPWRTPDTTSTDILDEPSTTTWERSDKNSPMIDRFWSINFIISHIIVY